LTHVISSALLHSIQSFPIKNTKKKDESARAKKLALHQKYGQDTCIDDRYNKKQEITRDFTIIDLA